MEQIILRQIRDQYGGVHTGAGPSLVHRHQGWHPTGIPIDETVTSGTQVHSSRVQLNTTQSTGQENL